MKRSGPPQRRTPLERATALERTPFKRTRKETGWADVDELWPIARLIPLRRDHHTCARCGQPGSDVHHRFALMMGGRLDDPDRHDPPRLICLCRLCHRWAHEHPADALTTGYRVRSAADALRVPVLTWTGPVFLTQDGQMITETLRLPE